MGLVPRVGPVFWSVSTKTNMCDSLGRPVEVALRRLQPFFGVKIPRMNTLTWTGNLLDGEFINRDDAAVIIFQSYGRFGAVGTNIHKVSCNTNPLNP